MEKNSNRTRGFPTELGYDRPGWTVCYNIVSPEGPRWIGTGWEFFDLEADAMACYDRHVAAGNCPTKRPFHEGNDFKYLGAAHQLDPSRDLHKEIEAFLKSRGHSIVSVRREEKKSRATVTFSGPRGFYYSLTVEAEAAAPEILNTHVEDELVCEFLCAYWKWWAREGRVMAS